MTGLARTLAVRSAVALLGCAPAAVASNAIAASTDMSAVNPILCTIQRLGDCKADGSCIWRKASEAQKRRQLKIDFSSKKAVFVEPGRTQRMGDVVNHQRRDGMRRFSVSRGPGDETAKRTTITVDASGKLRVTQRSLDPDAPRMVIEATCEKG